MTTRSTREQIRKLTESGVPGKWKVHFSILVPDCSRVERAIHKELGAFQDGTDSESFKMSPAAAKAVVVKNAKENIELHPGWSGLKMAEVDNDESDSTQEQKEKRSLIARQFSTTTILVATLVFVLIIGGLAAVGILTMASSDSIPQKLAPQVAELRGLSSPSISFEFIPDDELQMKLTQSFEEEHPEDEVRMKQEIYSMLGMMSEDQNLSEYLLDSYLQQSNSFYDIDAKSMYFAGENKDWDTIQNLAFVHEYTHVLQNRHFDLISQLGAIGMSTDETIAMQALANGDAAKVEADYARTELGITDTEYLWEESAMTEWNESMKKPLPLIQELRSFQFRAGLDFAEDFADEESVNRAYNYPPLSTEQILHPEKYLDSSLLDEPENVLLSGVKEALGQRWELVYSDVFGELMTRIYLQSHLSSDVAAKAAAGWGGDRLEYWKDFGNSRLITMYSTWDTYPDAQEYAQACMTSMEDRIKTGGGQNLIPEKLWLIDGLYFQLTQYGHNVVLFVANDEAVISRIPANRETFKGELPQGKISGMTTGSDPDYVYAIDEDNQKLFVLNVASIEVERVVDLPCEKPVAISYSPVNNNLYIISGSDGKMVAYNMNADSDSIYTTTYSKTEYGLDIDIDPKMNRLYVLSRDSRESYKYNEYLTIFDLATGGVISRDQVVVPATCENMAVVPGKQLLFISGDDTAASYSVLGDERKMLSRREVGMNCHKITVSANGIRMVIPCGGGNGDDYVTYDYDASEMGYTLGEWDIGKYPQCAVFSRDGRYLFATNGSPFDQKLYVMSTKTHEQVRTLDFPNSEEYAILCPTYNGEAVIGFCYDSIRDRDYALYYFPITQ